MADRIAPANQREALAPSGLVSLSIIARSMGLQIALDKIVRENQIFEAELSPAQIIKCANSIGLNARGLKLNWESLAKLTGSLPAILLLSDRSSMVLVGISSTGKSRTVTVRDPLAPDDTFLHLDESGLKSVWSGEVVLVRRGAKLVEREQPFNLRLLTSLIMKDHRLVSDIALSALMLSLLALAPIIFWRLMSERVLQYKAVPTFYVLCIVMLVIIAFETVFMITRRYMLLRLTTRVDIKLTTDMFQKAIQLPVDYYERTPTGLTLYKMGQIGRIRAFLTGQLFGTVLDSGIILFFVPVMFLFSPLLTSVLLGIGGLICAWIIILLPRYRQISNEVEAAESIRSSFLSQTIHGIRTVKSLAIEQKQIYEWDELTAKIARLRFAEGNFGNVIQAAVLPLERLMVTGTFALGVYLALNSNDVSLIGTLFTFLMLSQRMAAPLIQASQFIQQYDEARTAIAVVGSLVNQPPEEGRSGDGVRNQIRGHVEFSKVLFSYKGALRPALREVSFEIPAGTTLGVMGRSGSGKTTVTRLVQRLHSEYQGLIKIDGVDVRQYDLTHLRSSLGVVLQENFLFSGTIRSNITIAKPDATFEEMVHAARLAGAEEFIEKLPGGYETYIYEGSPNLSGGQRQRLAIARALITDPKILILDEATSALDAESEAIVNANIDRIAQGRTVITISHRLASLVKADAILVMEQGEVNDIGKHHELLERNEIYAHLWYTQNPHTAPGGAAAGGRAAQPAQITYRGPANAA